jgi:exodeoxyribonuclease VII small subunit
MMAKSRELSYSVALAELEEIIRGIETEEIDVDALAEKVARAAFLIGFCRDRLKGAEEDVGKIVSGMEQDKY